MSDVVETAETNAMQESLGRRQTGRSRSPLYASWCYTFNNYTETDVVRLKELIDGVQVHVFGKEVGDSGTPHLQGFIKFENRKRAMQVKSIIGGNCHVEYAKFPKQAIEYCKKDGDFFEYGTLVTAGQRCDIDDFKTYIAKAVEEKRRVDNAELRQEFSELYARCHKFLIEYRDDHIKPDSAPIEMHPLKDWQQDLNGMLNGPPLERKITFIVDFVGNSGKSWFAKYYKLTHPDTTQLLRPKKVADMAYELSVWTRVLFMDCARSKAGEYLQYDFLEEIKDGYVFSPKYESKTKYMGACHVVVMMNEDPDMNKLSKDRYDIRYI